MQSARDTGGRELQLPSNNFQQRSSSCAPLDRKEASDEWHKEVSPNRPSPRARSRHRTECYLQKSQCGVLLTSEMERGQRYKKRAVEGGSPLPLSPLPSPVGKPPPARDGNAGARLLVVVGRAFLVLDAHRTIARKHSRTNYPASRLSAVRSFPRLVHCLADAFYRSP